jgi:hypothetical protein
MTGSGKSYRLQLGFGPIVSKNARLLIAAGVEMSTLPVASDARFLIRA